MGEVENTMTILMQTFRRETDDLCASHSICDSVSGMITMLNNIALEIHPPVRVYSGAARNPTLNDWN